MNIKISEDKLIRVIQGLIITTLHSIKSDSDEWGMGEMDEIEELMSIDKITIDRIVNFDKIKVYVDIHVNSKRFDFDNTRGELQHRLNSWIPGIEIYVNDIIDDRLYGPGIDW
jgi:hypothetical protein